MLSTGIAGTIHIAKDDFYGQFTDHFEYNDQIYSIDFSQSICVNDTESPKVTGELLEIKAETKKVHITSNIEKINYAGTTFIKSKPKKWSPKKVFLTEDGTQLLVSLDIKQKGSNSKIIQKFYLGHKVMTDN